MTPLVGDVGQNSDPRQPYGVLGTGAPIVFQITPDPPPQTFPSVGVEGIVADSDDSIGNYKDRQFGDADTQPVAAGVLGVRLGPVVDPDQTFNPTVRLESGQEGIYTTFFGNHIRYLLWDALQFDNHHSGGKIVRIDYSDADPNDTLIDAGNNADAVLSGTVMTNTLDGKVEIRNAFLGTTLILDWSDPTIMRRTAEDGHTETAGQNHQVWVDFAWQGPQEGDFFRPFSTITAALDAVAEPGVIRIMGGSTRERPVIAKRVELIAADGRVTIGGS